MAKANPNTAKLQAVPAPAAPLPLDKMSKEAIVDEFGELDRRIQAFKPTKDRHELLRKAILGWYPDLPGDQSEIAAGNSFDVTIGLAQEERSITNMGAVFRAAGKEKFLKLCSVTLKALETHFGEQLAAAFIKRARTGSRKLIPVPKAPLPRETAKRAA